VSEPLDDLFPAVPPPLKEFHTECSRLSVLRWLYVKLYWGYKGSVRRVWLARDAADAAPLVVAHSVEACHCPGDAQALWRLWKPSGGLIPEFQDAAVNVSESAPNELSLRWKRGGLSFGQRSLVHRNVLSHMIALTQDGSDGSPVLERLADETRSRIAERFPESPRFCWHALGRWGWLLLFMGLLFGLGQLARIGIGDAASIAVILGGAAFGTYYVCIGDRRRLRKGLRKSWTLVLRQGDSDGTIRRALKSIGISLEQRN
jgi:hypothetical protein